MTTPAQFDVDEPPAEPTPLDPTLSPDRRRTLRQRQMIEVGRHPLSLVLTRPLRLHAEAATESRDGRRCGTCAHRQRFGYHTRSYPKCIVGDGARMSHGPATDVRAWWPACVDHEYDEGTSR